MIIFNMPYVLCRHIYSKITHIYLIFMTEITDKRILLCGIELLSNTRKINLFSG